MSPKKPFGIMVCLSLALTLSSFSDIFAASEVSSLQNQPLKSIQPDWLTHAMAACLMWRQANLYEAIREGKEACRLAPDNEIALMNLGLMLQSTEEYDAALACYEKAGRIDPGHFLPYLGTARCWIMKGDEAKGIEILKNMSSRKDAGFDWYYMAGQTCLKIKQNALAGTLITSAMKAAKTPDQLSRARNSLFLIDLRENKVDEAKELYKEVFSEYPPKDAEIYVRAAAALLNVNDTVKGKELLSCAINNLKNKQDSKSFFLLGRIFQDKARKSSSRHHKDSWFEAAGDAYTQAITMAPQISDHLLARADVYMQDGKLSEMIADLKTAKEVSKADPLPEFVLDNFVEDSSARNIRLKSSKIVKAKVSIVGLSCDCHLSKLLGTIRNIKGVACVSASGRKVFSGEIIYSPSVISMDDLISKTRTEFFKVLPPKKSEEPLSIKVLQEESVSLPDVFKHTCDTRFGPVLSFQESLVDYYNRFNDIQLTVPKCAATDGRVES
ncbi:MAG: hypothetical protein WCT03_01295 [Candidatus Obscuribacterales bacterium]|jgi:tetratricopeptide (TPR) repeat protein